MIEEWKDIEGFEGLYQVSNTGKVKSLDRYVSMHGGLYHKKERILKLGGAKKNGHATVVLHKEKVGYPKLVHRLVAAAFVPNPDNKPVVDHIDTDPQNNNADNLRWVTQKENCNNPLTRKHGSQAKMGHPFWGGPHTEEAKKKISEAHKGRKLSEEHRKKLSIAKKAYYERRRNKSHEAQKLYV